MKLDAPLRVPGDANNVESALHAITLVTWQPTTDTDRQIADLTRYIQPATVHRVHVFSLESNSDVNPTSLSYSHGSMSSVMQ